MNKRINDNIGMSDEKTAIKQKFDKLTQELEEAKSDIEYYKQFVDKDKIIERNKFSKRRCKINNIINNQTDKHYISKEFEAWQTSYRLK